MGWRKRGGGLGFGGRWSLLIVLSSMNELPKFSILRAKVYGAGRKPKARRF